MMTNALPNTAPIMIVPNTTVLKHISVRSIHRSSSVVVLAVVATVTNDESFVSVNADAYDVVSVTATITGISLMYVCRLCLVFNWGHFCYQYSLLLLLLLE